MRGTPQLFNETFMLLEDEDDEDVLNLLVSHREMGNAMPQELNNGDGALDFDDTTSDRATPLEKTLGNDKGSRIALSSPLDVHNHKSAITTSASDFTPFHGESGGGLDALTQAYDAFIQAQIENVEKICKEYTELTACEAQVNEFETEIVAFQRTLDVTDAIDLMQEQIEEVLRRKRHRQQVSDSLNEVYSALHEVDAFCEWIVKNHAHQQVDETYLSYLHRLGVKLTFLSRHKALHHSAVDDEIRPKLTAAAELAGDKILQYIASRIQQVQWEAPKTLFSSPTTLHPAISSFSGGTADTRGESHQESGARTDSRNTPGSHPSSSNSKMPSARATSAFAATGAVGTSFSSSSLFSSHSPHYKGSGTGSSEVRMKSFQDSRTSMTALHESLEQGEHYGFSFLKLYNPPVAKRIVTLYLQRSAAYYQESFSAVFDQLMQHSSHYQNRNSGSSSSRTFSSFDAHAAASKGSTHAGQRDKSLPNVRQDDHRKDGNRQLSEGGGRESQDRTQGHGSVASGGLHCKGEDNAISEGGDWKDNNQSSMSFLCPSSTTLEHDIEAWRRKFYTGSSNSFTKNTEASVENALQTFSPVLADVGAELDVVGYLLVLNGIHLKYGELHYDAPDERWEAQGECSGSSIGDSRAPWRGPRAFPQLWLPHFISVILLLVNTSTEECRFIGNFFCLAETQDGAVENYNDAEKVAKLLLEPLIDRFQPMLHSCLPQAFAARASRVSSQQADWKRQYFLDALSAIRVLELCKAYLSTSQDPIPLLLLSGILESCRSILRSSLSSMLKAELESFSQTVWSVSTSRLYSGEGSAKGEKGENTQLEMGSVGLPRFLWCTLLSIWSLDSLNTATLRASTFRMEVPPASDKSTDRFCVAASHLLIELVLRMANGSISNVTAGGVFEKESRTTEEQDADKGTVSVTATTAAAACFLLFTVHQARYMLRYRMDAASAKLTVLPEKNCGGGTVHVWQDALLQAVALQPWLYAMAPQLAMVSQWWWKWKANAIASTIFEQASFLTICNSTSTIGMERTMDLFSSTLSCRTLGDYSIVVASGFSTGNIADLLAAVQDGRIMRTHTSFQGSSAGATRNTITTGAWKEVPKVERQDLADILGPLWRGEVLWKEELHRLGGHLRDILESVARIAGGPLEDSTKALLPALPSPSSSVLDFLSTLPLDVIEVLIHGVFMPLLEVFPESFVLTKEEEAALHHGNGESIGKKGVRASTGKTTSKTGGRREGPSGLGRKDERRGIKGGTPEEEATVPVKGGHVRDGAADTGLPLPSAATATPPAANTAAPLTPTTLSPTSSDGKPSIAQGVKTSEKETKGGITESAEAVPGNNVLSVSSLQDFLQWFALNQKEWSVSLKVPKKSKKKKNVSSPAESLLRQAA